MPKDFDACLALVLAHSVLYETRLEYGEFDFRCEDDPKAPRITKSAIDLVNALGLSIPQVNQLNAQSIAPTEQALLQAAQQTSPGYAQLQSGITGQAMTDLAKIQAQLASGAGKDQALALDALARQIDPESYKARSDIGGLIGTASGALGNLLTQPVSEGELSAIERGLNRLNTTKGLTNVPSNTSTISNAMTFGQAGRDRTTQALQLATGFVPAATGFIPAAKSYDKSTTGDVASALAFSGGVRQTPTLGQTSSQTSNALLGQSAETQRLAQEIAAGRQTGWEKSGVKFSY